MAKIAICKNCGKAYDYLPQTNTEGGTSYITVVCPHCSHIKKESISHIHYGNDGRR